MMGAVGERGAVLAFKALGMKAVPTQTPEETASALFRLSKEGVKVIFITEKEAEEAKEAISRYDNVFDVAIIPIPGSGGTTGFGMKRVHQNVEKAIGSDILFSKNENKVESGE